jgi:AraC-like DNA-binding protein
MFRTASFHEFTTRTYVPPPELRCYIKSIGEIEGDPHHNSLRYMPAMDAHITFNLSPEPIASTLNSTKEYVCRQVVSHGVRKYHSDILLGKKLHFISVYIEPAAFRSWFKMPAGVIANDFVEGGLISREQVFLHEQLLACEDFPARVRVIEQWVRKRAGISPIIKQDPIVEFLKDRLTRSIFPNEKELMRETGYSAVALRKRFRSEMGVSMKSYAEVIRLHSVIKHLLQHDGDDALSVAIQFGFYDKSHFGHTIKKFTGFSPFALKTDMLQQNYHSLASWYLQ